MTSQLLGRKGPDGDDLLGRTHRSVFSLPWVGPKASTHVYDCVLTRIGFDGRPDGLIQAISSILQLRVKTKVYNESELLVCQALF